VGITTQLIVKYAFLLCQKPQPWEPTNSQILKHQNNTAEARSDSVQSQTPKVRTADKQTAKAYGS